MDGRDKPGHDGFLDASLLFVRKMGLPMSVTTAIAIYFVIWWVVLFTILPWGIRSQHEDGEIAPGTDPGAPALPRLWAKLAWTTIVSGLVFALCYVVYVYRLVSLDDLATLWGLLR